MIYLAIKKQNGFTLIESLIGIAIFIMLVSVVYQTFFLTYRNAAANWENTTVSSLASQYLETARNISYSQVGTIQGNPHGDLPDLPNASSVTVGSVTYLAYFEVAYIDDPADGTALLSTDTAPGDYKQVKLSIKNTTTNKITNYVTNIVPTGLESLTNGGALSLSVINSVGQPVPNATINITNDSLSPSINLTRTSNANGQLVEVGLPDSANSYHITATKNSYSSDQTYPISIQNPNPTKPDATIANGLITQISFSIDKTSNLTLNTLNQTCGVIPGVGLGIQGAKIIGTPNVLKYNNLFTSNNEGQIALNNIEWDNYTPAISGNTYMIYGSSPIQEVNILPDTTQLFNLILGAKTTNSLLIIVKDSLAGNPIEGASVLLKNKNTNEEVNLITGGSLWNQQDWHEGSGQINWNDIAKYFQDDGGINTTDLPLAMRLINSNGNTLVTAGSLESSTFDTGSAATTYTTISWQPASQDPTVTVKFQVAANNDNATWNFTGPDGTDGTYYTTPDTTISSGHNNKRYIRYKAYLSTTDTTKNPTITSVGINYVAGCFTPGQVIFPGLSSADLYDVTISLAGYVTKIIPDLTVSGYQSLQVLLTVN